MRNAAQSEIFKIDRINNQDLHCIAKGYKKIQARMETTSASV